MSGTFLRPNTALVERKDPGAVSPTGETTAAPATVHTALPCRIDPVSVSSRMGGNLEVAIEGIQYTATDVLFCDGMMPARFPSGWAPGDTFVVGGVTYTIAENGRAAFPDIQPSDRVTDETGRKFLVLAFARYSDVMPTFQARLAFGRSW